MSDTVKLVLWIVVAVLVIAVIVWLFLNAGRRREVEAVMAADARLTPAAGYAEGEPGDAGADFDNTRDGEPVDAQANEGRSASGTGENGSSDDTNGGATSSGATAVESVEAVAGDETTAADDTAGSPAIDPDADVVAVPALQDRDDVVVDGGTPSEDPGDHRGQPWATTPGQPGPEESDEPADEGRDVDMAPHSHESDEVSDVDEPAGSTSEEPRRQESEPAPDVESAAYPDADDTDDDTDDTADGTGDDTDDTARSGAASTSRRVSGFDEVVDGGFGLGSAAPIGDGAQPLGHAVKGTREGTTFLGPDDAGYDETEPDVWFYNEEAARRAGFTKRGE